VYNHLKNDVKYIARLTDRSGPGTSANTGCLAFLNQALDTSSTGLGPEMLHGTGETGLL